MFDMQLELKKLPEKPGVYIMKNADKQVIYVGKAVVLKNRVRQYFQSSANHSEKVKAMVAKIVEFEYIVTDTEMEALILENNLIKKYKPKFNILLKDDKTYPYIKVTMQEEYPRVIMTRRIEKDGAKYFGPYSNSTAVRETLHLIKKIFPIKTCTKVFPRDVGKSRPCLNYHIYQCLGPCQGDVNKEEYRALMKDICSFLNGYQDEIMNRLEKQMLEAAESMNFEKAASLRDKMNSLKHIAEKQKIVSASLEDQDVIALAKGTNDTCGQIFFVRAGKVVGREHFILDGTGETEDGEIMYSFVQQYYASAAMIPEEILLQYDIPDMELVQQWLREKRGGRVNIRVPKRGEKLQMIHMVEENARIQLERFNERNALQDSTIRSNLKQLMEMLLLTQLPMRIEAYDISNTGSTEMVASMVVFESGKPATREYRRFKIKSVDVQNDYGSMQEVLYRRFRHAEKEKMEGTPAHAAKFATLPDLILVDGGSSHVNAAKEVMKTLHINIPVFGMVKDDRHRTRGLASGQDVIELAGNIEMLRFITAIQDEAHRFALEYNKKLRSNRYATSALDEIPGIGAARKKVLIRHFGSVAKIRSAGIDDLMAIEGISRSIAENIYNHFHEYRQRT